MAGGAGARRPLLVRQVGWAGVVDTGVETRTRRPRCPGAGAVAGVVETLEGTATVTVTATWTDVFLHRDGTPRPHREGICGPTETEVGETDGCQGPGALPGGVDAMTEVLLVLCFFAAYPLSIAFASLHRRAALRVRLL